MKLLLLRPLLHLRKNWGLGSSRSDGVLLFRTTLEPPKRLASEAEGKSWLDGVVSIYAQRSGISLAAPGSGGVSGGGGGGATINSEEFLKFQADQRKFAAQHVELYMSEINNKNSWPNSLLNRRQIFSHGQIRSNFIYLF